MAIHAPQHFDLCLVLLQSAEHDARTLNIAESAQRMGKSVCIIALGTSTEQANRRLSGIMTWYADIPTTGTLWKRWIAFYRFAYRIFKHISAKQIWAEDVFCLPLCALVARRYHAQLIYDSREIFSALGALQNRAFKQAIIAHGEKFFVSSVQTMVVSGRRDAEYLAEYFQRPLPTVVMNLPHATPLTRTTRLRDIFNIDSAVSIILYQGAISHGRGIAPMIRALPYLDHAVFCILGDGEQKHDFMRLAEELHVSNRVIFCGKVPYQELHQWTASADIGLAVIEPISFSYSLALPNKLFEYAMAGLPVVASNLPAMRDILDETSFGVCVENFHDAPALAETLRSMLLPSAYMRYHVQALHARERYTWQAQEHVLREIFPSSRT